MSRNILITNDDGVQAPGLARLASIAKNFGNVTVIAPDQQCSAMSHHITLHKYIEVYPVDFPVKEITAYSATATPSDCVRFGLLNFVPNADLVLSGINYGNNCGSEIQYSATVGAALEAAQVGVHAIAFSEGINGNPETNDLYLFQVLAELIQRPLPHNAIWNVNFPNSASTSYKGILWNREIASNAFYCDSYDMEKISDGGYRLRINGEYREVADEGTDMRAVIDGYISIGVVNNLSSLKLEI